MIVDVNVSLSRWPFRRLRGDEPRELAGLLSKHGVTQAWAASFDGLLHKDIAGVNMRLARDCRAFGRGLLLPFGSLNPMLPEWREDLRRCHEDYRMPGIRLHPNYHGYHLKHPVFAEVLAAAAARRLIVQLPLRMEDERTQHPLLRVPPADAGALLELVAAHPRLRLVLMHWKDLLRRDLLRQLASTRQVYFDISMLEGLGNLIRLVEDASPDRVLFGSNFPLFYFESALLKVREAGLAPDQEKAVLAENARRLLQGDG